MSLKTTIRKSGLKSYVADLPFFYGNLRRRNSFQSFWRNYFDMTEHTYAGDGAEREMTEDLKVMTRSSSEVTKSGISTALWGQSLLSSSRSPLTKLGRLPTCRAYPTSSSRIVTSRRTIKKTSELGLTVSMRFRCVKFLSLTNSND